MVMNMSVAETVRRSWVQWAINLYRDQLDHYEKLQSYYEGEHSDLIATERWKTAFGVTFDDFADNWCQVVVDAVWQRMEILGWECDIRGMAREAEAVWDASHVDIEADELHQQTLIKGDGYLIIWPNEEEDRVDIFFNDAQDVNVQYDPANKRRIIRGFKRWELENGEVRLNVYHPDRLEQFIVPKEQADIAMYGSFTIVGEDLPSGWVRYDEDIPNPYGIVPIFHFKNRPSGSTHGISELETVMPIQNMVNKVLMDMALGSEFAGFPQKWMAGGGHPKDGWKAGADRVWASTDPAAKFGQFEAMDLEGPNKFVEMLVGHIAKTTQTPMHYLRTSGDMPSGEALKTAESGLIQKAKKLHRSWGHEWGRAMSFAIYIQRELAGEKPDTSELEALITYKEFMKNDNISTLKPVWRSPETRHDLEQAQTAQLKSILGVPLRQLWSEHFGYTEEEIQTMEKENKQIAAAALAQLLAQQGQAPPGVTGTLGELLGAPEGTDLRGLDIPQVLAMLSKGQTSKTTAGEATTRPQPNTRPPASPTRRSTGFKD